MRVTSITVEVKSSRAVNEGEWKTVALGAEATLENGQSRQEAQAALYRELAGEFGVRSSPTGPQRRPRRPRSPTPPGVLSTNAR